MSQPFPPPSGSSAGSIPTVSPQPVPLVAPVSNGAPGAPGQPATPSSVDPSVWGDPAQAPSAATPPQASQAFTPVATTPAAPGAPGMPLPPPNLWDTVPQYSPQAASRSKDSSGTVALVLAFIAIPASFILLGWAFAIAAIIVAIIALRRHAERGMAIAAISISGALLVLTVVGALLFVAAAANGVRALDAMGAPQVSQAADVILDEAAGFESVVDSKDELRQVLELAKEDANWPASVAVSGLEVHPDGALHFILTNRTPGPDAGAPGAPPGTGGAEHTLHLLWDGASYEIVEIPPGCSCHDVYEAPLPA